MGLGRGRLRVGVWDEKIGNLRTLALRYVQRDEIPADLPVKTTDDVDQGGGDGDGRKRVRDWAAHPPFFVLSSPVGIGHLLACSPLCLSLPGRNYPRSLSSL